MGVLWLHPDPWTINKIILLNKPGKPKSDPSNYRPITLIYNLSKILEKIVTYKIKTWAEVNNKLNKEQSGFRVDKSANDKLFELAQIVAQGRNRKHMTSAVFLDIEKAFDKVWHRGLIYKLMGIGLPAPMLRYVANFIKNRHIYFTLEGNESPLIYTKSGVPQGSSISPILFILYVADIPIPHKSVHLSQFADDIKLFSNGKRLEKIYKHMQAALDGLVRFCGQWRIGLNSSKTVEVLFGHKLNFTPIKLTLLGRPVERAPFNKFLGVTFDRKSSFDKHVSLIHTKAFVRLIYLKRIYTQDYGPSASTMLRLFKIFIRPLFEYGSVATITANPRILNKWEGIQSSYIAHILGLPSQMSHVNLRKFANVPSISDRLLMLAKSWYNKSMKNNPDVRSFIEQYGKDFGEFDKFKTPLRLVK